MNSFLDWQFKVDAPDRAWVIKLTYITPYEGWLHRSGVIDMFLRRVVGRSAQPRITAELALQAWLADVWQSKPTTRVMTQSDQGRRSPAELGICSLASTIWTPA